MSQVEFLLVKSDDQFTRAGTNLAVGTGIVSGIYTIKNIANLIEFDKEGNAIKPKGSKACSSRGFWMQKILQIQKKGLECISFNDSVTDDYGRTIKFKTVCLPNCEITSSR